MSQSFPGILPVPQEVVEAEGAFHLTPETQLVLLPEAGESEWRSARAVQREIREATGLSMAIVKPARLHRSENIIVLGGDTAQVTACLGEPALGEAIIGRGEQAYYLSITPQRVVAGGDGPVAVHHAAQSLRQIARLAGVAWPACQIHDWPVLPYRGLMLDVSRGKVPTLATLKAIVDHLALFKMNVLQLYTEHTFDFPSHPRIGAGTDPLTTEDMLALDAYARARHVELMPNLNSFGHCGHLLGLPEYAHLSETVVPWTLTPQDESTYTLLGELYDDMLPAFSSRTLNAGCDETWDLGKGRSAQAAAEIGVGRVYLQHLLRLHAMARERGYRIQFWGDILLHHPELVPELPEDVILLDWHYEAQDEYPSVDVFAESGRPFWVCPGTSSWNALFPRIENANGNIRNLARAGAERGAEGLLNTDWGDHGHYQPLGQCWYGYAYGAAQAWSGGQTDDGTFDARFGPLWFGAPGAQVTAAIRALGRLNTLPGIPRPNTSNSIYMLLEEPLAGELADQIPAETLGEMVAVCAEAEETLRLALPTSRDPLSLEEMIYSARMMAYAARKVQASHAIRAALADPTRELSAAARQAREKLRALELELAPLQAEFVRLWRARARDSEIGITLGHLAGLRERYALAQQWLAEHENDARIHDVDAYMAWAGRYEILGQRFWRLMQSLAGVS
jgi:hypothetical protein